MNVDLDHDDQFGNRMRALRSWEPAVGTTDAWRRIEQRHRRTRLRRAGCGAVAVVIAFGAAAIVVERSLQTHEHVSVVSPSPSAPEPAQVLGIAPVATATITPPAPYRAGEHVRVTLTVPHAFVADSVATQGLAVCYPWSGGEICDATTQSQVVAGNNAGTSVTYDLAVPGWVLTPTGAQACDVLHCRFELGNTDGTRIGTAPVDIVSGPEPATIARIESIHASDAGIDVSTDGVEPDPSWSQWSATAPAADVAALPSGHISICVLFTTRPLCDGLLRPDPPRFDGKPHALTVETNRLLFTPSGWVDCTKVECVIELSRTVDVQPGRCLGACRRSGASAGSESETIALLPYQLPPTTQNMPVPTLSVTPTTHLHIGDTITVTLHDPPPHVDSAALHVALCAADAGTEGDCSESDDQPWSTLTDGSIQQLVRLDTADPNGQYVTILPPNSPSTRAYPYVARTDSILVSLTDAEQQQVDANRLRRTTTTVP